VGMQCLATTHHLTGYESSHPLAQLSAHNSRNKKVLAEDHWVQEEDDAFLLNLPRNWVNGTAVHLFWYRHSSTLLAWYRHSSTLILVSAQQYTYCLVPAQQCTYFGIGTAVHLFWYRHTSTLIAWYRHSSTLIADVR
jgi:hypothetical protein